MSPPFTVDTIRVNVSLITTTSHRQADRQTGIPRDRQADRQADRLTDRQSGKKRDRRTDGRTSEQRRETDRQTDKQTLYIACIFCILYRF